MGKFIWPSIGFYCLFSVFVFYQQLHTKHSGGGSQSLGFLLPLSAFAGTITGVVYLGVYGWNVSWLAAVGVFVIGLIAGSVGPIIERMTGPAALSLMGFVGWPACAYFMFKALPSGT